MKWKVNTSNPGKLGEYRKFLGDVEIMRLDLAEPESDPYTIVQYKASQFSDPVIVDDVALFVHDPQGGDAFFGTNIRWELSQLEKYVGHRATFLCLLAIRQDNNIHVFKGETPGQLVAARGSSFGFNKYFMPDGSTKTFGEEISDALNPRKIALDFLRQKKPEKILPLLQIWSGAFQNT